MAGTSQQSVAALYLSPSLNHNTDVGRPEFQIQINCEEVTFIALSRLLKFI